MLIKINSFFPEGTIVKCRKKVFSIHEKNIKCMEVDSRQKLGIAVGLSVSASSVAVIEAGEAEKDIASLK